MPDKTITHYELNALDKRLTNEINALRDEITSHTQFISELNVKYDSLADLPKTIIGLNETLAVVRNRLEAMNTNMNFIKDSIDEQKFAIYELKKENANQNKNITKIDNKSKIDWATAITNNFWKVITVIAILVYIAREFILK